MDFKAPFPWFGGKSKVASDVWARLGHDTPNYIEPFFGSGAILLGRPEPSGVETVNDKDGMVSNFWRAVQHDPDAVAHWADWPAFENDLHARHCWLIERRQNMTERLEGDPEYYDSKIAGWWVWGISLWIGRGWCSSGTGPWWPKEINGERRFVKSDAGKGVSRQRVHLGNTGKGVSRKMVHLGRGKDHPGTGECGILEWMRALADRFRRVRVCCGDWSRVCGGHSGRALSQLFTGGDTCAIFLDPPYSAEASRYTSCYGENDDLTVAHDVCKWAIQHGDNPKLRIALCGYQDEHQIPNNWECLAWKARGGMASIAKTDGQAAINKHRERIWFSPHCLQPNTRPNTLF